MVEDLESKIDELISSYEKGKKINDAFDAGCIIEHDMRRNQDDFIDECKYYLARCNYPIDSIHSFDDLKSFLEQKMPELLEKKTSLQNEINDLTNKLKTVNTDDDFYNYYLNSGNSGTFNSDKLDIEKQLNEKREELDRIGYFEYYSKVIEHNDASKAKNLASSSYNDIIKYKDSLMKKLMENLSSKVDHLEKIVSNPELLKNELVLQGNSISDLSNKQISELAIKYYIGQYNSYYNYIVKTYYKVLYKINSLQGKPKFDEDEFDDFLNNISDILNDKVKKNSLILQGNITKTLNVSDKLKKYKIEKDDLSDKTGYFSKIRLNYINKRIIKLENKQKKYKVSRQNFVLKNSLVYVNSLKILKASKEVNGAKEIRRVVKQSIGDINSNFNNTIIPQSINTLENGGRER